MRGTDLDYYPACQRHRQMAENNLDRYIAHLRTKDKFLGRKEVSEQGGK